MQKLPKETMIIDHQGKPQKIKITVETIIRVKPVQSSPAEVKNWESGIKIRAII